MRSIKKPVDAVGYLLLPPLSSCLPTCAHPTNPPLNKPYTRLRSGTVCPTNLSSINAHTALVIALNSVCGSCATIILSKSHSTHFIQNVFKKLHYAKSLIYGRNFWPEIGRNLLQQKTQ